MSSPVSISVVTPNYNCGDFLQPCLSSILSQRQEGLEYIVVDGASSDQSSLILGQYEDQIDRLIIEPDTGHANALNKGFAEATGEIMCWVNSDDIMLDGAIEFVTKLFEARPDIDWITGRASSMDELGDLKAMQHARAWSRLRFLAGDHYWIQQESTFWRRSLWEKAGSRVDESFSLANDFELWARFFRHAQLHTVDRQLGCFRVREGQRSVEFSAQYKREARQVLKRELGLVSRQAKRTYSHLLCDTPTELSADEKVGLAAELSALDPPIIDPLDPKADFPTDAFYADGDHLELCAKSDLSGYKNKHAGQRCFIMGNGPSLNQTDLSLLEGEVVFGCNLIHLLFDRIDWRPTYYACVDSMMLRERASELSSMLDEHPSMVSFFPIQVEEHTGSRMRSPTRAFIPEKDNRLYFQERYSNLAKGPFSSFSLQPDEWVAQSYTVTITLLQLAVYMGFKEIFLIGCDTQYKLASSVSVETDAVKSSGLQLKSAEDDDENHFDRSYFGAGRRWHAPNLPMMIKQYESAKLVAEYAGARIYNATVGGQLEVYPRIALQDIFDDAAMEDGRRRAEALVTLKPNHSDSSDNSQTSIRVPALIPRSIRRNLSAVIVAVIIGCAALAGAFLVNDYLSAIVILIGAMATLSLVLNIVLIVKTRRIMLSLVERVEKAEASFANSEVKISDIVAKLSSLLLRDRDR